MHLRYVRAEREAYGVEALGVVVAGGCVMYVRPRLYPRPRLCPRPRLVVVFFRRPSTSSDATPCSSRQEPSVAFLPSL
jgi:hypothetical protein